MIAHYTDYPGSWGGLTSQRRGSQSLFYAFDFAGNTRFLMDSGGDVTDTMLTTAFGKRVDRTGSSQNAYGFGGETGYQDEGEDQFYVRARVYDCDAGRWLSMDPLGFGGGDVNLYAYCGGNPVGMSDPSGTDAYTDQLNAEGLAVVKGTRDKAIAAADWVGSWIPVIGSARESVRSIQGGNRTAGAIFAGLAVVEAIPGGKVVRSGGRALETGGKAVVRRFAAPVVKREAAPLGGASVKALGELGEHAAETGTGRALGNSAKNKEWKKLIHGKAQKTGTPGHQVATYRVGIRMAKSGKCEAVYLDKSYEQITGLATKPTRFPDVAGVRKSGRILSVEIASASDKTRELLVRNRQAMSQLGKPFPGKVRVLTKRYPRKLVSR